MLALSSFPCFAEWTKDITCKAGEEYRDVRVDAGRGEYCVRILPGSLEVKDGPFRFWFNPDFEGASGDYKDGRKVGKWKECDRFARCEQKNYPELDPYELQHPGIKPEIPITYVGGKYIFDFSSCRSTWVTHTDGGKPDFELNIGSYPEGCTVSYLPDDVLKHGGSGDYTCKIPFAVGKKTFDSLDLLSEFPKMGLPQYCERPKPVLTGPIPADLEPSFKKGLTQIFTATYDTGNNGSGIAQARLHFQKNAASRSDRCVVRYDPGNKSLYLLSDQSGKFLGPIAAGSDDSLWNNECLLSGCSNAELSGTTLTVHFAIRFNPIQFAGQHHMYIELVDNQRNASPAGDVGEWTVPSVGRHASKAMAIGSKLSSRRRYPTLTLGCGGWSEHATI